MQLKDTCAEGDGDRNNINKKRLLLYFKSSNSFTKYSIEMFTSIAQIEAIVSEEMAERLTWGCFVNWHGGEGKNIANDAAQEICNDSSKDVVKGMGANKTTKAILRASQSGAGVHEIKWSFDKATNIHRVSHTHSARSSVEHELMMLQDLRKLRPFRVMSGRCHAHFPDIAISTTANLGVESCSLGWKGTRTKLEGPFSQDSFIMYV